MDIRTCPECGGKRKVEEPMNRWERTENDPAFPVSRVEKSRRSHWVNCCPCCRGEGYIYFGEMYPTPEQLRSSKHDYRAIIQPSIDADKRQWKAELEKQKDPVYLKEKGMRIATEWNERIERGECKARQKEAALKQQREHLEKTLAKIKTWK